MQVGTCAYSPQTIPLLTVIGATLNIAVKPKRNGSRTKPLPGDIIDIIYPGTIDITRRLVMLPLAHMVCTTWYLGCLSVQLEGAGKGFHILTCVLV